MFGRARAGHHEAQAQPKEAPAFYPQLFLSGVNTPVCVQLLIDKPTFVLGKSESCDGVLAFNDEISREHCRIAWHDGDYTIADLNSTNSTCLNGSVLIPGQEYPLHPGDRLQLSASTFLVEQIYSAPYRRNAIDD